MPCRVLLCSQRRVEALIKETARALESGTYEYIIATGGIQSSLDECSATVKEYKGELINAELCIYAQGGDEERAKCALLFQIYSKVTILMISDPKPLGCGCKFGTYSVSPLNIAIVLPSRVPCSGRISNIHKYVDKSVDILLTPHTPEGVGRGIQSHACVTMLESILTPRLTISTETNFTYINSSRTHSPFTAIIGMGPTSSTQQSSLFAIDLQLQSSTFVLSNNNENLKRKRWGDSTPSDVSPWNVAEYDIIGSDVPGRPQYGESQQPESGTSVNMGNIPPNMGNIPPNMGNIPPNMGNIPPNMGSLPPNMGNIPPNMGNVPSHASNSTENRQQNIDNRQPNNSNIQSDSHNSTMAQTHTSGRMGNIPPNMGNIPPNMGNIPPNMGNIPPNMGNIPPNMGNIPPNMGNIPPNMGQPSNMGNRPGHMNNGHNPKADLHPIQNDCSGQYAESSFQERRYRDRYNGSNEDRYTRPDDCNRSSKYPRLDQSLEEMAPSRTVYITNLPYGVDDSEIKDTFNMFGPIARISFQGARFKRSRCTIQYHDIDDAERLVKREPLELHNRAVHIKFARNDNQGDSAPPLDLSPHDQCWFCLANPHCERALVVWTDKSHYVALAKGGVTSSHFLLTPIGHYPALAFCPKTLSDDLFDAVQDIKSILFDQGYEYIYMWERYFPMKISHAMHMQIQIVGLKRGDMQKFVQQMKRCEDLNNLTFERLPDSASIVNIRERVADMQDSYTYIQYLNKTEKCSYIYTVNKNSSMPRMPINMAREVLCSVYDWTDRESWKSCLVAEKESNDISSNWRRVFCNRK